MLRKIRLLIPSKFLKLARKLRNVCLQRIVKSQWLVGLYYATVNQRFHREQMAVLNGRLKYLEDSSYESQNCHYLLRRNIHRLEKGLLMHPRRGVFALDYIEETVNCFRRIIERQATKLSNKNCEYDEIKWAHSVLTEYFSVVTQPSKVTKAKKQFVAASSLIPLSDNDLITSTPFKRDLSSPSPVNYEELLALSVRRKSVRWYLPKNVPRELIDKAVMVAAQSPSACNRQPFEFRIFDSPDLVKKVAGIPLGTSGFAHNIPAIAVVVGKLRAYLSEQDRHVIYIDASLASMSFAFALETLGLSSCFLNWPDREPQESQMAKLLKLEKDERVIMSIAFGYPDPNREVAYSQKKRINMLRRYNFT